MNLTEKVGLVFFLIGLINFTVHTGELSGYIFLLAEGIGILVFFTGGSKK